MSCWCVVLYSILSNHSLTKPILKTPTILDRSQLGFLQTLWYSIIMAVGSLAVDMTLTPQWEPTVNHQQSCLTLHTQSCSCTPLLLLLSLYPFVSPVYPPTVYYQSKQSCKHLKMCTGSEKGLFAIRPSLWCVNLLGCPNIQCVSTGSRDSHTAALSSFTVPSTDLWSHWAADELLSSLPLTKWTFNYRRSCLTTATETQASMQTDQSAPVQQTQPHLQHHRRSVLLCIHSKGSSKQHLLHPENRRSVLL